MKDLDFDTASKWFRYCPNTGVIWWKKRPSRAVMAGDVAGSINRHGYVVIVFKREWHPAHRIAWLLHHGEPPNGEIDHINHITEDNRIKNLRVVSRSENMRNASLRVDNKSGVCGVCLHRGCKSIRWEANIRIPGKNIYLGLYADWFDAVCARKAAENKYNYHPNHGGRNG